ncbi:cupin domain-containing protein [Klebsiella variicola]|uniref:cupin domain-containing protein n=1 Tax=Klebsiella variicola TaxID=244366 RepID=UPI002231E3F2|nr:cupin domain-containing protein [Klebsiella variicola]HCI9332566.1 cupin domain-containing protein [Klebsiella variicola]
MLVNHDFARRASVRPTEYDWVSSPRAGVDRVMLDRIGAEKARATSIVKYQPGSHFPEHHHPDGEEILVLSGIFSEGKDHYPAGWYMRNPPDSAHQPSSSVGAMIFVKLRQMDQGEHAHVRLDTNDSDNWHKVASGEECPLFSNAHEKVMLRRLLPHSPVSMDAVTRGAEILVLSGMLHEKRVMWPAGSWLRFPSGDRPELMSGDTSTLIYLKTGHLEHDAYTGLNHE